MSDCPLCAMLERVAAGDRSRVVWEFPHSVLVVGDHRFFEGYCVLVYRGHVRDLHLLDPNEADLFLGELVEATRAVAEAFGAAKMNHASYGNLVPHLHWHLFPRQADEPEADRFGVPWKHQERFCEFPVDDAYAADLRRKISTRLRE